MIEILENVKLFARRRTQRRCRWRQGYDNTLTFSSQTAELKRIRKQKNRIETASSNTDVCNIVISCIWFWCDANTICSSLSFDFIPVKSVVLIVLYLGSSYFLFWKVSQTFRINSFLRWKGSPVKVVWLINIVCNETNEAKFWYKQTAFCCIECMPWILKDVLT